MKTRFKKVTAMTLAMTMCIPSLAFADTATTDHAEGSFTTSFGVYAPAVQVSVPVNADIQVNPLAAGATGEQEVKNFTVASNSLDVWNSSVEDDGTGIPVNITVHATITNAGEGVMQVYDSTFEPVGNSTQKKIYLELEEATTAATATTAAKYTLGSAPNKATITKYGSLLSVDVAAGNATTPTVGSFAVIGKANANADWQASDIAVGITYKIKASKPIGLKTPTVGTLTVPANNTAAQTITIADIGDATVAAMALHNEVDGVKYGGDFMIDGESYEVTYAPNASDATKTDATITIPAANVTLQYLADTANGCKGKPQELIIGLSDGRMIVTTLTVN